MRVKLNRNLRIVAFLLVMVALIAGTVYAGASQRENIVLLASTDLHGHINPIDYFTGAEDPGGLAQIATVVSGIRAQNANVVLVDDGDCIEGGNSTLPVYYRSMTAEKHPMAIAMNLLKYDSMTLGNHEFNYGLDTLNKFAKDLNFPLISANIVGKDGKPYFKPYIIKKFGSIEVGVIGITSPKIPIWEKPSNITGLSFPDPIAETKKYVQELKAKGVDVIIVAEHTGWEQEPKNGFKDPASWMSPNDWVNNNSEDENFTLRLANQVPDVDVIIAGHSHSTVPVADKTNGKITTPVIISQPGSWGDFLSRVDLTVEGSGNDWKVVAKTANIIPMKGVASDPAILAATKPYHDATWNYYTQPLGTAAADMPGGIKARFYDTALIRMINEAQLKATGADISLAALFTESANCPAGPINIQKAYGLYIYPNTLYKIEINGKILRAALEHDAKYFNQYTGKETKVEELINSQIRGYNWDVYAGVQYKLDISKPAGERVVELKFKGKDVTDDQVFTLALNNYRAGGGGGFTMFRDCKILWQSDMEVREYLVEYIRSTKVIDPSKYPQDFQLLPAEILTKFGIR